jgi:hypothetical protein
LENGQQEKRKKAHNPEKKKKRKYTLDGYNIIYMLIMSA